MDIKDIIMQAIQDKRMINFSYEGRPIRKAAPHAIYYSTAGNLNLDAFQYDGFSKTGRLPDWRNFSLSKIRNLELLNEKFEVASGYKPHSNRYSQTVFKI